MFYTTHLSTVLILSFIVLLALGIFVKFAGKLTRHKLVWWTTNEFF